MLPSFREGLEYRRRYPRTMAYNLPVKVAACYPPHTPAGKYTYLVDKATARGGCLSSEAAVAGPNLEARATNPAHGGYTPGSAP